MQNLLFRLFIYNYISYSSLDSGLFIIMEVLPGQVHANTLSTCIWLALLYFYLPLVRIFNSFASLVQCWQTSTHPAHKRVQEQQHGNSGSDILSYTTSTNAKELFSILRCDSTKRRMNNGIDRFISSTNRLIEGINQLIVWSFGTIGPCSGRR